MSKSRTDLVKAALKEIFDNHAWFKGRIWGLTGEKNNPCKKENPFGGSHTTIGIGAELVTVVADHEGKVKLYEYVLVNRTKLGNKIARILREKGMHDFKKGQRVVSLVEKSRSR